jgi:hypothetical protein
MAETDSTESEARMATLEQYKLAGAASNVPTGATGDAISLMGGFYSQLGMGSDPIVAGAMQRAMVALQQGVQGISDPDLRLAVNVYAGKFDEAYNTSTMGEILTFAGNNGYTDSLPDNLQTAVETHNGTKLSDLDINDPTQKTLAITAQILRNDIDRVHLIPRVTRQNTNRSLEGLAQDLPETPSA